MEGTCHYCDSGTSNLQYVDKPGVGRIKVCDDCMEEHHPEEIDSQ